MPVVCHTRPAPVLVSPAWGRGIPAGIPDPFPLAFSHALINPNVLVAGRNYF